MGTRLGELVERFGGQLAGDANLEVTGIAPLADAGASHISFLSNSKFRAQAAQSGAAALVCCQSFSNFGRQRLCYASTSQSTGVPRSCSCSINGTKSASRSATYTSRVSGECAAMTVGQF